jgi:hypothetical protein
MKKPPVCFLSLRLPLFTLALLQAPFARAQLVYDTEAAFVNEAIQPGYYLENFELLPSGDLGKSRDFPGNPATFSYTVTASASGGPVNLWGVQTAPFGTSLSTDQYDTKITITFAGGNVTAVGGVFFLTDVDGNTSEGTLTVRLTDNTTHTFDHPLTSVASGQEPFLGLTALPGTFISSLEIIPNLGSAWATVENVYVGTAVPEPSQWTLSFGLIGLAYAAIRRCRANVRYGSYGQLL